METRQRIFYCLNVDHLISKLCHLAAEVNYQLVTFHLRTGEVYLEFQQAVEHLITNALKKKDGKKDELKSRNRFCTVRHRMTRKKLLHCLTGTCPPRHPCIPDFSCWRCALLTVQLPVDHVLQRAEPLQQHLVADAGPPRRPVASGPLLDSCSLRSAAVDAVRAAALGPEGHVSREGEHVQRH